MSHSVWEKPPCPICHTQGRLVSLYNDVVTWEYPGIFAFKKCFGCGLVFQTPRVNISHADRYYRSSTYWGVNVSAFESIANVEKARNHHYGDVYKYILNSSRPGRILDIGSGLGLFLSKFKESGWEVLGTETAPSVAAYSRKMFRVPVKLGVLENIRLPAKYFDVISMLGVFEHVYTPQDTLKKIHSLLKPQGLLVMTLPNISSVSHTVFGKKWYHLEPGRHLYHYSPQTITQLLSQSGFRVEKISFWIPVHNYDSLFNSFRFALSPKYSKSASAATAGSTSVQTGSSLKKLIGIQIARVYAGVFTLLGPLLGKSEVFIVYARKN